MSNEHKTRVAYRKNEREFAPQEMTDEEKQKFQPKDVKPKEVDLRHPVNLIKEYLEKKGGGS